MRRLGGTARIWRTDRLATVITPGWAAIQYDSTRQCPSSHQANMKPRAGAKWRVRG